MIWFLRCGFQSFV